MPLTALAFWLAYVIGLATSLLHPYMGVALYVLVYHLNPETQWWGSSVQATGLRTSFTVALATAVGMLIRWPRLHAGAKQFPTGFVLTTLFVIVALGSLVWGVGISDRAEFQAEKFIKLFLIIFIIVRCVRTPTQYQVVFYAWIVGVAYLGYQATGGVGQSYGGRLTGGLGGPDFAESSGLAVHLVATLPLVGAAFFMARSWFGRAFVLVCGALTVNTLIMTRTRNALPGLALMAVAAIFSLPRGYRLRGLAAVVIGSLLALQLTDPGWWERMQSVTNYHNDESAAQRIILWKAAWHITQDYPFGIGLGNFHSIVRDYAPEIRVERSAHNTILACLAELGWPGLMLYLGIIAVILRDLTRVRKIGNALEPMIPIRVGRWDTRFHLGWHAMALRAGLLGYLGCALFTTRVSSEDYWLLIAFACCLRNIANQLYAEDIEAEAAEIAEHRAPRTPDDPSHPAPAPHPGLHPLPVPRTAHSS